MSSRPIIIWLGLVCLVILGLVAVGGVTRLTGSGLSMVDWKPLMGVVPPTNDAAWQARFDQYQQYPEYQLRNEGMTLPQFKRIFLWEYSHRLLARFSGIAFLVPYLYFLARRRLSRALALRLGVAFVLGGLQGLMGWYMVRSGLVDNPYVSHYRLAAHLGLALLLCSYLLWIILDLLPGSKNSEWQGRVARPLWVASLVLLGLVSLQILYGAFTAGLDAGYMFNTFPRMLGRWVPPGLMAFEPAWLNLLRNATTVQFVHRYLAWTLLVAVGAFWLWSRRYDLSRRQRIPMAMVTSLMVAQFAVGVATLVLVVPVPLAVVHQVLACLLLGAVLALVHALKPRAMGAP